MMKKILAASIIIILAIASGYFAHPLLSSKSDAVEKANASPRSIEEIQAEQGKPVKVGLVTQKKIDLAQTFYGTVAPYAEANVQGKYSGKLIFLKAEEGENVSKGEVIVKFDDSDTQLQLQQAVASKNSAEQSVNQAKSNFETTQTNAKRYQELFKDGFVPKQTLDDVQNQLQTTQSSLNSAYEGVKTAEAAINILKNTLKDLKITAPISGIIDEKYFNLNEIPGANDVICHIVDIDQVYIEVEIPETYISEIREEMNVEVILDSLKEQQFAGTIERVIPTGNAQNRSFVAKVLVENSNQAIKPGMFARVNVTLDSIPEALVFDKKALLKEGEEYYVFKVNENQAQKVAVNIEHRESDTVAVTSEELHVQDQVIIEGVRMLQPNDRIKIL